MDDVGSMTPLAGGWSGRTFLAEVGDVHQVVRIYPPEPGPVARPQDVHAALHRLVRGLVPVPDVVDVVAGDAATGRPGLLVTAFVDGERGDVLLPRLPGERLARLGAAVGAIAGTLAGMPQLRAGRFVDGDLRVEPFDGPDEGGLPAFVDAHLVHLPHWTLEERAGLRAVAADADALLDTVARVCVVHSDLNPKNLLVDPGTVEVTAVVDWEFAHAGHPHTDLGNLLRFDRAPAYAEAVLGGYCAVRGDDPAAALGLARAADLWALVDLAARRGQSPVTDRAEALLRRIATTRDAGAAELDSPSEPGVR